MNARRLISEKSLWQSYKRQSIQEAVIRLMCREGLKSVTMERVAQEVGIAKGTVYLHYRDKQALLDAVKESSLDPMSDKLFEIFKSDMPADKKLQAYSMRYLTYFDDKRDLFRILLYEREIVRVQSSRYRANRYRRIVNETTRVIQQGIDEGVFRDVDAANVASMFVEANFAILNQRLLTESPAPVEKDAQLITEIFFRGLAATKEKRK